MIIAGCPSGAIESTLAAVPDKQDLEYPTVLMENRETGSESGTAQPFSLPDTGVMTPGRSGEVTAGKLRPLGCVQCHMPLAKRPLVDGGVVRNTRQHLWRGGHDPAMVEKALTVEFVEVKPRGQDFENDQVHARQLEQQPETHETPS